MKTNASLRAQIQIEYHDIGEGEEIVGTCPACLGGSSHDKSFSITRKKGKLLWICFRDSCAIKGSAGSGDRGESPEVAVAKKNDKTEKRIEKIDDELKLLPAEAEQYFEESYPSCVLADSMFAWYPGLSPQAEELSPLQRGRLAMPIMDWWYNIQGYVLRDLSGTQGSKALTFRKDDYKGAAWSACIESDIRGDLFVVEDLISADAVRQTGFDACALLGTHLTDEVIEDINSHGYRRVWIALDKDAVVKAAEIVAAKKLYNTRLLPLEQDFKNMDMDSLLSLLEETTMKEE